MGNVARCRKATKKRVERKHACPNCDARFPFPNKLRLHINSNHSLANACELCPERFNRFNELRTHMRRAHQIIHRCHLCAYSSSVKSELRKHVIRCHENGVRCTVDGCVATVAYNRLRRHIEEAHCDSVQSIGAVGVEVLVESPESENNLAVDLSTERKFSPAAEGSTAANTFHGSESVNIYDDAPPVDKMQKPSPKIPSQKGVASLSTENDGTVNDNDDCIDCCGGNEFIKAFKTEQNNSDDACREKSVKVSTQSDSLGIDDQTASRKKSFICSEAGGYECRKCGKIFYDFYNSRRHWNRVHLKKYQEKVKLKKYACEIPKCTQRFSCPSKLQDHMLAVHSESALFDCETCNRNFSSRATFAIHLRRYHLVSIQDVPYGFTDRTGVNSSGTSDNLQE